MSRHSDNGTPLEDKLFNVKVNFSADEIDSDGNVVTEDYFRSNNLWSDAPYSTLVGIERVMIAALAKLNEGGIARIIINGELDEEQRAIMRGWGVEIEDGASAS